MLIGISVVVFFLNFRCMRCLQ